MRQVYPMKIASLIFLFLIVVTIMPSCGGGTTIIIPPPQDVEIRDLKGVNWQDYVGEKITVSGIYVADPVPMIVSDIDLLLINAPLPEDEFILLSGPELEKISAEDTGGAMIKLEGIVTAVEDPKSHSDQKVTIILSIYEILDRLAVYYPYRIPLEWLELPSYDRYAVLFSGGINDAKNYIRYWNDLVFMYTTLINECSFAAENITVLYADGTAEDASMTVDFSATQANLETVFTLMEETSDEKDLIFVFFTNHGGGFYEDITAHPHWYGGQLDTSGDEGVEPIFEADYGIDFDGDASTNDQVAWDEEIFTWGGGIMDDAFVDIFSDDLVYDTMIVLMEQCFSAGPIADMASGGPNRIIMSAAGEYEPSRAMPPSYNYDEFSYHFTCALNWATHDGTSVDADINGDNMVSMVEAFNYARSQDTAPETPNYEDDGDGVPSTGAMPSGTEGTLGGNTTFH